MDNQELLLTAASSTGLPDISSLRIFPLEGQPLPVQSEMTGISSAASHANDDEAVSVFSLSGVLLYQTTLSQLGISLGGKPSAVVVLPNCVGDTPYIVRKQRLK